MLFKNLYFGGMMVKRMSKKAPEGNAERYWRSPRFLLLKELYDLISDTKKLCSEYVDLGPSPYDDNLGYTKYYLKKYKKLLNQRIKAFKEKNNKKIEDLGIKEVIMNIIIDARAFEGKEVYKKDPNARPGTNHHTGLPYY